jgi:hypothetical protein
MDNLEKLATLGTRDEDKQNKNTTQYLLDTTIHKQTQITLIRHETCYKHEHRYYPEIVTDTTTRNSERKDTPNNVVIIWTNVLFPRAMVTLVDFGCPVLGLLVFQSFHFELKKIILDIRRDHQLFLLVYFVHVCCTLFCVYFVHVCCTLFCVYVVHVCCTWFILCVFCTCVLYIVCFV